MTEFNKNISITRTNDMDIVRDVLDKRLRHDYAVQAGKGSKRRPNKIEYKSFEELWDAINWTDKK